MKPTLVIGASDHSNRYAYKAIRELRKYGNSVNALALHEGKVDDVTFETEWDTEWDIDTVTLYINPTRQPPFYSKIVDLKPKRVIFNPGTENMEFVKLLEKNGIKADYACTLVLLAIGKY